jgi:hypothetical protein
MQSICDKSFYSLIKHAFELGWQHHSNNISTSIPMDIVIKNIIPSLSPGTVNQALNQVYRESRSDLISIFNQYKYVSISIDGVSIKSRKFLNIDIVNPISKVAPFTYDFFEENSFDTDRFVDKLYELFVHI